MQDLSGLRLESGPDHPRLVGLWMQMHATQDDPVRVPNEQLQTVTRVARLQYQYRTRSFNHWSDEAKDIIIEVTDICESGYSF